jgi:hypothetical protein
MFGLNPFSKTHDYKTPANVKHLSWKEIIRLDPEKVDKNIAIVNPTEFNDLDPDQQRALLELVKIKESDKLNKSLEVGSRRRELENLIADSERRINATQANTFQPRLGGKRRSSYKNKKQTKTKTKNNKTKSKNKRRNKRTLRTKK